MDGEGMEPVIAATKRETDKKCPYCGGVMDFNPETGNLACPYCGHEEAIEVKQKNFVAKELDFDLAEEVASVDWGTATKTVRCKACGAETVYDVNEIANECPYCGSNQVMEERGEHTMAPSGIVVFRISAKEASERFRNWIGKKFFCPKLAKQSARPKAFKGLYIPFWTFDANTASDYTGEYGIDHQERDKDGKMRTRTVWRHTRGRYNQSFDDVLVCGSTKQDEAMLKKLEPFDTKKTVAYKPEYMAGFMAERYTVKMKTAWEKAKGIIKNIIWSSVSDKIRREHLADHTRNVRVNTEFRDITYKYLLLPVWISSFQYKGRVYHFMVNGQTGEVSGKTPISWVKVAFVAVTAAIILTLIFGWASMDAEAAMEICRNGI